jgi:hypothetical protein
MQDGVAVAVVLACKALQPITPTPQSTNPNTLTDCQSPGSTPFPVITTVSNTCNDTPHAMITRVARASCCSKQHHHDSAPQLLSTWLSSEF